MKVIADLNPKAIAAAAALQAKRDVRYYLCGVFIEPRDKGGVTISATDGHVAISVIDMEGSIDEPRIVALDAITLNKCKAKKADRLEITCAGKGKDVIYLARVTGLDHHLSNPTVEATIIDGRFPSMDKILPDALPAKSGAESPALAQNVLRKMLDAAKVLAAKHPAIRTTYKDKNSVALVEFSCDNGLIARGAAMPMRIDLPEWTA